MSSGSCLLAVQFVLAGVLLAGGCGKKPAAPERRLGDVEEWQAFVDAHEAIRVARPALSTGRSKKSLISKIKSAAESERDSRLEALGGVKEAGMLSSAGLATLRDYCTLSNGIGTAQHIVQFIGQVEIRRLEQLAAMLSKIDPKDDAQMWVSRRLRRIARSDVDGLKMVTVVDDVNVAGLGIHRQALQGHVLLTGRTRTRVIGVGP